MTPNKDIVNLINNKLVQQLPGEYVTYKSIDTVVDQDQEVQYPVRFIDSLDPPGMPTHNQVLKHGATIMILRNLDTPSGATEPGLLSSGSCHTFWKRQSSLAKQRMKMSLYQ